MGVETLGISSIGLRPWTVYGVGRDFGMTSHPTKAMKAVVVGRKFHIGYGGAQDMQYVDRAMVAVSIDARKARMTILA